jgi:alkanesulfonate monooxygenase SsuD/methylene tetrahydromethanopterin reductase-like flavin-dependent oxidoreductase (luciferase family)
MQKQDNMSQYPHANVTQARPLREHISLFVQAGNTLDTINKIHEAEQAGVRQVWLAMGGAGFADVLTVLAVAAAQTTQIALGTAIVPVYTRHPVVMAQQALAIHDLAPDRLRLGIGTGNRLFLQGRYGLPQTTPLSYLREYIEILRSLLWTGGVDYQGRFFQVTDTLPRTARVPLLISALGLKAFHLAGEVADGALAALCPIPYMHEQAQPALRAGAEAAGRPTPQAIASLPIALSENETRVNAAVSKLIRQLAQAGPHARMFARAGWGDAIHGDEAQLNTLARSLVISGSENSIRARLQELLASGLDELQLLPIPIADPTKEHTQLLRLIGSL